MTEQHDRIDVYTDGACSYNPGPAGLGVVLLYKGHKKEISRFIGDATNNIAELMAIKVGLEAIKKSHRNIPIVIYTDSKYCHGLFTQDWNPKKNVELIMEIKSLITKFRYIGFKWVKAHKGNQYNELADQLAVKAVRETQ
jgi:ribonuclease HI